MGTQRTAGIAPALLGDVPEFRGSGLTMGGEQHERGREARYAGGDQEQLDFGTEAGPGRPGKVIRRNPNTGARYMDWLSGA
jgi:hypothetical protein